MELSDAQLEAICSALDYHTDYLQDERNACKYVVDRNDVDKLFKPAMSALGMVENELRTRKVIK